MTRRKRPKLRLIQGDGPMTSALMRTLLEDDAEAFYRLLRRSVECRPQLRLVHPQPKETAEKD